MKTSRIFALLAGLALLIPAFPLAAQAQSRPKVALVLEGGSAWGFAHIGVLKVIEELGIPVDIVVGTSMGSIVGGLYASGYSAGEIETIASGADWKDLFMETTGKDNLSWAEKKDLATYATTINFDRKGLALNGGAISGNKILRFFDTLLAATPSPVSFDALPRRFRAVATDIATGERVVFDSGSLPDAMRASMSIPGVFEPYYYEGRYLVDGGVVDNLPINLARDLGADIVIAVDLVYAKKIDSDEITRSPILSLARTIDIMTRNPVERQLANADIVLTVNMESVAPTDFVRVSTIAALGERIARAHTGELLSVRSRVGQSESVPMADIPPVSRIIVEGSTPADNARLKREFAPIAGMRTDTQRLDSVFSELDASGQYDLIRVRRDSTMDDFPLIVTVRKKTENHHELKLGYLYDTTISTVATANLDILPALILRNLTTPGSELRISGELLDTPDIAVSFVQPLGSFFSATPFWAYLRESTTRIGETSYAMQYQTTARTTGLRFDLAPFPGFDWYVMGHYDHIIKEYIPDVRVTADAANALVMKTGIELMWLDSPIFPMNGIEAKFTVFASIKEASSGQSFRVAETSGSTFLSLGTPFSVAFLWKTGTDFSVSGDDSTAAPAFYKPSLADRRMFPGPLSTDEEIGSHVGAIGLELKHNLNWKSPGITLPVFIILQTSIGAVVQNPSATDWNRDVFQGNATAGIGLRVNDGFGAAFRAGVQRTSENTYIPFIAFDLGALGL